MLPFSEVLHNVAFETRIWGAKISVPELGGFAYKVKVLEWKL